MYRILTVVCLCTFAIAAVIPIPKDATILNYDYQNDGRGNYHFSYVTSNGIKRNETGQLVNEGQQNEHIAVRGFYAFTDQEGKYRHFEYTADENGYNQVKVHINVVKSEEFIPSEYEEYGNPPVFAAPAVSPQLLASLVSK